MADFQIPDKNLLTSVDRTADSFLIYDNDALALKRTTVDYALNVTSQPVGIDDVQTVTNKTLDNTNTAELKGNQFTLVDHTDITKKLQFSMASFSSGVTRTITVPNGTSTMVTTGATQTLTNKTLTSPTISSATISNPTLTVDTISEFTSANGITVDGLNIKDGKLNTNSSVVTANVTDGAITPSKWANQYKFSAYRNAAANTGNGAFAKIAFDTELFDSSNNFASGTYTAPIDGFYQFTLGAAAAATVTNQRVIISLYINSAERRRISTVWSSAAQSLGPAGGALLQLTAGDDVEVYIFGTAALALDVSAPEICPYFMGYLVTPT